MKPHTDEEMLAAAHALARPARMFIKFRGGKYHVYRASSQRAIHLGFRKTPAELLHYIERLVAVK